MEQEIDQVQRDTKIHRPKLNLIEVFCSDQSTLTDKVNQQGRKAMRFGLSQGNLQQPEERKELFRAICRHCPEHNG